MTPIKLTQLGFTDLESDIYLVLLARGALTGYAVGKELKKPVANVYKALESLSGKGAVVQSRGEKKLFKAMPWQSLLEKEELRHADAIRTLRCGLENFPKPDDDEAIYQFKNADQTLAEGLRVIAKAQHIILADLEPAAVAHFADALADAAARGVEVRVKVYKKVDIPGARVLVREQGEQVYESTEDVRLLIVADGRAFVYALFKTSMDMVIQAFASGSALMNLGLYSKLVYELILTELNPVIGAGDIKAAQLILDNTAHLHPLSTKNPIFDVFSERYRFSR